MTKLNLTFAVALFVATAGCSETADNNVAVSENQPVIANDVVPAPVEEPVQNAKADQPADEQAAASEPAKPKDAPAEPEAKPKVPAPEKKSETTTPPADADCPPEHREAGHC